MSLQMRLYSFSMHYEEDIILPMKLASSCSWRPVLIPTSPRHPSFITHQSGFPQRKIQSNVYQHEYQAHMGLFVIPKVFPAHDVVR